MRDRADFAASLDAKDEVKQEPRYQIGQLSFRIDSETRKICVFTEKLEETSISYGSLITLTNVEDAKHQIQYILRTVTGHTYSREYLNKEDQKRYGVILNNDAIYTQLFGEKPGERAYTLEELRQLIPRMNERKERAKYNYVDRINIDDSVEIPGLPNNSLLVAMGTDTLNKQRGRGEIRKDDFYCFDKPELQIQVVQASIGKKMGNKPKLKLRLQWNNAMGKTETFEVPAGKWERKKLYETYENFSFGSPRRLKFDGFTPEALTKILKERNKGEKEPAIGG